MILVCDICGGGRTNYQSLSLCLTSPCSGTETNVRPGKPGIKAVNVLRFDGEICQTDVRFLMCQLEAVIFFLDVHKLRRLIFEKCLQSHMHAKCKLSLRRLQIKVVNEGNMVFGGGGWSSVSSMCITMQPHVYIDILLVIIQPAKSTTGLTQCSTNAPTVVFFFLLISISTNSHSTHFLTSMEPYTIDPNNA